MVDVLVGLDTKCGSCGYGDSWCCTASRTVVASEIGNRYISDLDSVLDTTTSFHSNTLTYWSLTVKVVRLSNIFPGSGDYSSNDQGWEGICDKLARHVDRTDWSAYNEQRPGIPPLMQQTQADCWTSWWWRDIQHKLQVFIRLVNSTPRYSRRKSICSRAYGTVAQKNRSVVHQCPGKRLRRC